MFYFDHAAATPLLDNIYQELVKGLKEDWVNSASAHALGKREEKKLELYRKQIAELLNCLPTQIFFLSSVTEANNWFVQKYAANRERCLYYTSADHASIVKSAQREISQEFTFNVRNEIEIAFNQEVTNLILFSAVNSQAGLIFLLEHNIRRCKQLDPNSIIGIDGSQWVGRYQIDLQQLPIDFLSISSHKLGGPKGIAACFIRHPEMITPLIYGGGHEFGLRSATVSVSLVRAFSKTLSYWQESQKQLQEHFSLLEEILYRGLEGSEISVPFSTRNHVAHIHLVVVPGISSDIVMRHLELEDIYLSSTSACSSKSKDSRVFKALQIDESYHKNILRISFAPSTRKEDVYYLVEKLKKVYQDLVRLQKRR